MASEPNFDVFGNAPKVILITVDEQAFSDFVQTDCAAAAENILIAAESLGIGSRIMTITEFLFKSEKGEGLKEELKIPEGYKHVCTIALGYRDGVPVAKPEERRNNICKVRGLSVQFLALVDTPIRIFFNRMQPRAHHASDLYYRSILDQ